ncbi:MAG: hypothetical protein ABIR97_11650 [Terracoccus sp.]
MPYVLALAPTIGVGALFYFLFKNILEGDRRERIAQAKWDAERDAEHAAASASHQRPPAPAPGTSD